MANIYEPPTLEYQLDEDMTAPTLDMSVLEEIAASHGIDLNQPLTKENAAVLNYAFQDNSSFPEGTMVAIYWNEETNSGELSVVCPTVLHKSDDSFPGGFDPDFTTTFNDTDQLGDPNQSYSRQVLTNNQESGNDHGSAIPSYWRADGTVFARNLYSDEEGMMDSIGGGELDEQHPYYVVNQRYVYKLNGTSSVRENVEAIDSQMSTDRWFHLDVQGMIDSGDPMYAGMEVSTLSTATQANYGRAPEGGDLFFGYYDTNRNEGFNIDWEGYVPIENGDMVTYDGFAYPAEYITHYEENIALDLRTKMEAQIGYSDPSLNIVYDYKSNQFVITSDYLGEPITVSGEGLNSSDIVSSALGTVNETIASDDNCRAFRILEIINQKCGKNGIGVVSGQEYNIVQGEDGRFYFITEKSTIEITPEELLNPEKSKTILMIADAVAIESRFKRDDFDVSIQDTISGDKVYRVVNGGNLKYYTMDENGLYIECDKDGKVTGETKSSDLGELIYQEDVASGVVHNTNDYNSRIARNRSRAISVVDEELYDNIESNFKGIDFSTVSSNATNGCRKISECYPGASSVSSSIADTINKITNDMDLLSRLIDGVVNLYVSCDTSMKKVLDDLLFGGKNSMESFADKVFGMKGNITAENGYTDEEFVAEFHKIYKEYLKSVSVKANEVVLMSQGNMIISDETFKGFSTNSPLYGMIETDSKGIHYIDINKLSEEYKTELTAMFNCENVEDMCQAFTSSSSKNLDIKDVQAVIATPLANYFNYAKNLADYTDFTESYCRMRDTEPFVDYMFTEEYRANLEEVRRTGMIGDAKLEDTFMSPAEFAMCKYLEKYQDKRNIFDLLGDIDNGLPSSKYKLALQRELNMREGREKAANSVLEIINGDITWDDYLRQTGIGTVDGLIKLPVGISHLWSPQRTADEWSQIYVKEFLEGKYDLDTVNKMYKNGELSDKEYALMSRLTGNSSIEGSRRITKAEKTILEGSYDIGYSLGDNLTNMGVDGLCAILSSTGVGALGVSLIKNGIKAASTAGYARTEQYEERILHDEDFVYPLVTFISTFGTGVAADALKAAISGDSFTLRDKSTPSGSITQSGAIDSSGTTGQATQGPRGTYSFKNGKKKLLPILGWFQKGKGAKEFGKAVTGFTCDWINDAVTNETWNETNGITIIGRGGKTVKDNTKSTTDSFTSELYKTAFGKFNPEKIGKKIAAICGSANQEDLADNIWALVFDVAKGGMNFTKFGVGYDAPSSSDSSDSPTPSQEFVGPDMGPEW